MSHLGDYKLNNLLKVADKTPQGAIVELGIYKGGTLFELAKRFPERMCFGFDTFEGMLKEHYNQTEGHTPREFQSSYEEVKKRCRNIYNTAFVKGVFPESYNPLRLHNLSFIHMDMDHGDPTKAGLDL